MIYVVAVALVLLATALSVAVFRIGDAVRRGRPLRTRVVRRSGRDRRQRQVPVAEERRIAPRRQDDIARRFLREVERAGQAATGRPRASRQLS